MEIKTVAIVGMGALGMLYGEQLQKVLPAGAVRFVMDKGALSATKMINMKLMEWSKALRCKAWRRPNPWIL